MSNLKRYYSTGQRYFVTIVTHDRNPVLAVNHDLFRRALEQTVSEYNAKLIAWVVLPEHCHLILTPLSNDLSKIIHKTKVRFAAWFRSQKGKREGRVWQNRFWDHIIRNEDDMNKHIDYIHYNPVKHGLCQNPFRYELSSASEFLNDGLYSPDWGVRNQPKFEGEFGE